MLQCVAVCCCVLLCAAVRCSVLHCVAVCGSVVQWGGAVNEYVQGVGTFVTAEKERNCFYYIIVQTFDVGLHSRRHPKG